MSRRPRRNHTPAFKAKVALAAIKGDRTLVQLSAIRAVALHYQQPNRPAILSRRGLFSNALKPLIANERDYFALHFNSSLFLY
jgi:transposase-like protein